VQRRRPKRATDDSVAPSRQLATSSLAQVCLVAAHALVVRYFPEKMPGFFKKPGIWKFKLAHCPEFVVLDKSGTLARHGRNQTRLGNFFG